MSAIDRRNKYSSNYRDRNKSNVGNRRERDRDSGKSRRRSPERSAKTRDSPTRRADIDLRDKLSSHKGDNRNDAFNTFTDTASYRNDRPLGQDLLQPGFPDDRISYRDQPPRFELDPPTFGGDRHGFADRPSYGESLDYKSSRYDAPDLDRRPRFDAPLLDSFDLKEGGRDLYRSSQTPITGSFSLRRENLSPRNFDRNTSRFERNAPLFEPPSGIYEDATSGYGSFSQMQDISFQPPNRNEDSLRSNYRYSEYPRETRDPALHIYDFDPDNSKVTARQWLNEIDRIAAIGMWTEDEQKFQFANKLVGSAKNFLKLANMKEPWYKIRKAFIHNYPSDMEYHDLLTDMLNIKQTKEESLLSYFNAKLAAIKTCEIIGQKAVSLLVAGLYDKELKLTAYEHNFASPDELFGFLNQTSKNEINIVKPNYEIPADVMLRRQELLTDLVLHSKYVLDVEIDRKPFKGYASLDSEEVTITEDVAKNLNLKTTKSSISLRSFGSKMLKAKAYSEVHLRVQGANSTMKIYIVSSNDQAFPVIIGKSFGMQRNIRFTVTDQQIEFYEASKKTALDSDMRDKNSRPPAKKPRQPKYGGYDGLKKYGELVVCTVNK